MKNDITYEYRKFLNRPNLIVRDFEIGECTYDVLMKELKKPFNGRAYHTTDTNQFFYDWNGKRYELNWLGKSATVEEKDISELKKQIKAIQDGNKANENEIANLKKTVNSISDISNKVDAATQAAKSATQAAENAQGVADELKSQLENLGSFLTQDEAKETYQPKGEYATEKWVKDQKYLTEHQSLNGYATEEWVEDQKYLTEHQSLDGYATEKWVKDQKYLTEHQSLEGYVTEDNMNEILKDYLTGSEGIDVSELVEALKDYLTDSDIADFVTIKDLEDALNDYLTSSEGIDEKELKAALKEALEDYITGSEAESFVKSEDLPDFEEFVKKEDLPKIPTYVGGDFVSVSDDDSDNEFVISLDVDKVIEDVLKDYLTSSDAEFIYATKEELEAALADYLTSSEGIDKDELEAALADYLTSSEGIDKEELDAALKEALADYLTSSDAEFIYATKDDVKKMIEDSLDGSDEPIVIPTYIGSTYVNVNEAESENVNVVEVKLGNDEFIEGIEEITNDTDINVPDEMNGLVTMSQVIELIKKKSNEEVETVDYLYTNGYKLGDEKIDLSASNQYVIEMDDNGEFVIEMLHSNEEDGWYDEFDTSGNYIGEFFYVMIPNDYEIKNYLWDPTTQAYKTQDTSVTDPSFTLMPYTVTPTSTIYYYKDPSEYLLVQGAKSEIEDTISQTYNNHLIKIVIKKK